MCFLVMSNTSITHNKWQWAVVLLLSIWLFWLIMHIVMKNNSSYGIIKDCIYTFQPYIIIYIISYWTMLNFSLLFVIVSLECAISTYVCYIANYSYYFYYGEYHSCGDGSQKVADDDDRHSFVHISLTGK